MKIPKIVKEKFEYFFQVSTLHGLKYMGRPVISVTERLFWITSFLCAVGFAGYFSTIIFDKYNNNRVIISLNSKSLTVDRIPFPTTIICNMNRVSKIRAEKMIKSGINPNKEFIHEMCNKPVGVKSKGNKSHDDFLNFLIKTSPTCEEMIRSCKWNYKEVNCNDIFRTTFTDLGVCCSFNQLPLHYIFRNPISVPELNTYNYDADDWSLEKGYSHNSTENTVPLKLKGSGLTLVLDTQIHDYYCSSTHSVGFQVLVINPTESPKIRNYAINIPVGIEGFLALVPTFYNAIEKLRFINLKNRKCFFNDEKELRFFRTYTFDNCITECHANYTLQRCNCVPYFLMSNISGICTQEHDACLTEISDLIGLHEKPFQENSQCKCLPACFELSFAKHTSYGRLVNTFKINPHIIGNQSVDYFVNNSVILNIYYPSLTTSRLTKTEIYGHLELLSNMGGLLAIFLGFSFLGTVEVFYHFVCKIFPVLFNSIITTTLKNRRIYPFMK